MAEDPIVTNSGWAVQRPHRKGRAEYKLDGELKAKICYHAAMDEGRKRVASDAGSGMLLLLPFPAWPQATYSDLTSLSLEDLMNTKVTWLQDGSRENIADSLSDIVITAADMHGAHDTALEQG